LIGHIWRVTSFLEYVIEGKVEERSEGKMRKETEAATGLT